MQSSLNTQRVLLNIYHFQTYQKKVLSCQSILHFQQVLHFFFFFNLYLATKLSSSIFYSFSQKKKNFNFLFKKLWHNKLRAALIFKKWQASSRSLLHFVRVLSFPSSSFVSYDLASNFCFKKIVTYEIMCSSNFWKPTFKKKIIIIIIIIIVIIIINNKNNNIKIRKYNNNHNKNNNNLLL